MKIQPNNPSVANSAAVSNKTRLAPSSTASAPSQVRPVNVAINPLANQVAALEQSVQQQPVVDSGKVAAIKQAIAEGKFSINPNAIADGLISSARELLAGRE